MSLLERIRALGRRNRTSDPGAAARECVHGSLVARWADAKDMGNEDKATEFVCTSCQTHFTPQEAGWVRKRAVERLRRAGTESSQE